MVLRIKENPRSINEFTDREISWIFETRQNESINADSLKQKRSIIQEYMHTSEENYQDIIHLRLESESFLLPDEELTWIKGTDIRLARWLVHYCSKSPWPNTSTKIPMPELPDVPESAYYEYFVYALDNWSTNIHSKSLLLSKIKSIWTELLLKDRKLKWLRKDDKTQIEWAWAYLNAYLDKHKFFTMRKSFTKRKYSPILTEETYLAIMSTFDTWNEDTGELYLLQTSMKQAWAQQKYRADLKVKKKKQSTYVLSETTKDKLQELATENNVNLNQMLEHIIKEAYKNLNKGKATKYPEKDDN